MKLRTKILLPFYIFLGILSLRFIFMYFFINNTGQAIQKEIDKAQKINELTLKLLHIRQESPIKLLSYRFGHDATNLTVIDANVSLAQHVIPEIRKNLTSPEGKTLFASYISSLAPLKESRVDLVKAIQLNNEKEITSTFALWQQRSAITSAALDKFSDYNFQSVESSELLYRDLNTQLVYLFILTSIMTVLFIIILFIYLRQILTKRILEISTAAHDISEGKFDVELAPGGNDELGDLAMSINKMGAKLKVHYQQLLDDVQIKQKEIQRTREFEEQKDMFISLASHELKTPLTSIRLFEEFLMQQAKKEHKTAYVTYLKKMDMQIAKLASLITSLLDFTKIKVGRMSLNKSDFDIQEAITEAVEVAKDLYPTYSIVVNHTPNLIVHADKDKIGQVLTNLVDNAIKYSLDKKKLVIGVHKKEDKIVVSLEDYGQGIPYNQQQKIFERFYQVSPKASNPGLGLGLFICSEIIKHHGGKIWVESTEGKGSTFYFSLPL